MTNALSPRIKSKILLNKLFTDRTARVANAYPLRILCLEVDAADATTPIQVLFSVSKRHFKHAVDRNRAKRQMREVYRLNMDAVGKVATPAEGKMILLAFIWLSDDPLDSKRVTKAFYKGISKLSR